jgi:hypothetical protein
MIPFMFDVSQIGGHLKMTVKATLLAWLPCLLAAPLFAQPQIVGVGGPCNSSTLKGTYSLSLTGRDVASTLSFATVLQGVGTATFDGLSNVSFQVTNNTNSSTSKVSGPQTWSGTYSLQSNCIGVLSITTGNAASFTLGSYDGGVDFFIDGQDGIYSYLGNGNTQPSATCAAGALNGTYAFNGNGFALSSGVIGGVNQVSGLMTFNGTGTASATWIVSVSGSSSTVTTTGTYTVTGNCMATVNVTDGAGNAYILLFTLTSVNGTTGLDTNFAFNAASPKIMFSGNGRTL